MSTPTNGVTPENAAATKDGGLDEKKYFQKVLDDVVSINSWFTVAMFVGLSFATPGKVNSLDGRPQCDPDANMRKRLVFCEIASFTFYVFSGFLGKTTKLILYIYENKQYVDSHRQLFSLMGFYLSIYGTMTGSIFLLLAMFDVAQIKLGRFTCGCKYTRLIAGVLFGIIAPALYIYFSTVSYGLYITTTKALAGRKKRKDAAA